MRLPFSSLFVPVPHRHGNLYEMIKHADVYNGIKSRSTLNSRFLTEDIEALIPEGRDGEGFRIPEHIVDEAILLRREQPSRSVPSIIRVLELEGKVKPGELKRTTLQDAMSRRGYSASMMNIYQDTSYGSQRFQRQHRFDLWQGDIKYGPMLMVDGKKPTYFCCLIDDATRYIVHGEFYDNMGQSMSRVAHCIDNGPMGGFWGILKRERYYGKRFTRKHELVQMILE